MIKDIIPNLSLRFDKLINNETDTVYLSGSRFEGFGNQNSDIDVFIVSDMMPNLPDFGNNIILPANDQINIDIEIYSHKKIREIISSVNNSIGDNEKIKALRKKDLDLYYRTLIGQPEINPNVFYSIRALLRKELVSKVLANYNGIMCQQLITKAIGSLNVKDLISAYFFIREALECALDSYLALNGECYVGPKWRFEKIRRRFGEKCNLYNKALKLRSLGTLDIRSYTQECVAFCSELGMDRFPKLDHYEPRYTRSANVKVISVVGHAFAIHNEAFVYQLSDFASNLLMTIDEKLSESELADKIVKHSHLSKMDLCALTNSCLDTLLLYGLVNEV